MAKTVFHCIYLVVPETILFTETTATLETGIFKVPQVVVYKMGSLEYSVVSRLVKVNFISLVNLIADKEVIKELIQDKAEPEAINQELIALLNNENHRNQMLSDYDSVYKILDTGSASDNTARLMLETLNKV